MRVLHTYQCLDGREFPVEFADEGEAAAIWYWDPEHNPEAMTPMDEAVWRDAGRGAGRARAECGFHPDDIFIGGPGIRYFHGFSYSRPLLPSREVRTQARAANRDLQAKYGSAAAFWQTWGEPRTIAGFETLKSGAAELDVPSLIDTFGYGFEQTFLMFGIMDQGLRELLAGENGDDGEQLAVRIALGRANASLEADQALWDVARLGTRPRGLRTALLAGAAMGDLPRTGGTAAFRSALEHYLENYGWRTTGWDVSSPMVRERPEMVMAMIRRIIAERVPAPESSVARVSAGRDEFVRRLSRDLAGVGERLVTFHRRLDGAAEYLAVKESRALRQLNLTGALRHCLLERGRELVRAGAIREPADIFYLTPEEAQSALERAAARAGLAGLAARRRLERERWLGAVPPARIGGAMTPQSDGSGAANMAPTSSELTGVAASPGRLAGVARVIRSLDDLERLGEGEILVCVTTTPAWTALFALAGAVVADGGDMVSHTAIAAREYGIPAVTGAHGATSLIRDGETVTVDGDRGVVVLHP